MDNDNRPYKLAKRSLTNELISTHKTWAEGAAELRKLDDRFFLKGPRMTWFFDDVVRKGEK